MRKGAPWLLSAVFLLILSTTALAQDSFTARIPTAIAAGNYAEAQALITEAVKIGVISTAAAESYRKNIQQAQERSATNPTSETTAQQAPKSGSQLDRVPLPYKPNLEEEAQGRIYVTYTKLNRKTRRYYSGRTSMIVDLRKSLQVQAENAVRLRDTNHHADENNEPEGATFDPASVDEHDIGKAVNYNERYNDLAYWRIRGREQQLIDFHGGDARGGAQSDTGEPYRTENAVRAVAKDNKLGKQFHDVSSSRWGQLYPYTGH